MKLDKADKASKVFADNFTEMKESQQDRKQEKEEWVA